MGTPQEPSTIQEDPRYTPTHVSPVAARPPAALPEVRLPGYEIESLIGQGGMGYVLKARDLKLDRTVAIKMPLPALLSEPSFRDRFLREARSAARLRHPNICPIYEVGESEGVLYIVMAYLDGTTLRKWASANRPPARQAAGILAALSRAVDFAHQNGIIHRDLKPDNVLIERETRQPMLMDFGLAKETQVEGSQVTQSGQIFGTPAYMPPEQAAGRAERMGPWSDVYSLGAILYELLTGRPPFAGTIGEVIHKVQHEEPLPPRKMVPTIHRDLEVVCLKAMAKAAGDRYPTASALALDLEAFAAGEAIQARPPGRLDRLLRAARRHPRTTAYAAASILLLSFGVYFSSRALSGSRRAAEITRRLDSASGALPDEASLASREALCVELERLDPAAARQARERILKEAAASIRAALREARLEPPRQDELRAALEVLGRRDKILASALREEFQGRLSAWELLFDLTAPFEGLEAVFEPGLVVREQGGLAARPGAGPVLGTRIPSGGSVLLEARLQPGPGSKPFGVGLGGYQFLLFETGGAGTPLRLEIRRGGSVLREVFVPGGPGGGVDLKVQREGPLFTLRQEDRTLTSVEDVFPLAAAVKHHFELILPAGARATRYRASRRPLAARASPLERADELYHAGRHDEALAAYYEQVIQGAAGPSRQEARYKVGVCQSLAGRKEEALQGLTELAAEPGERWPMLALCQVWLMRIRNGELDEAETLLSLFQGRYDPRILSSTLPDDLRHQIIRAYGASTAGPTLLVSETGRINRMERAVRVVEVLSPTGSMDLWVHWNLVRACHLEGDLEAAVKHARRALERARLPDGSLDGWGVSLLDELSWLLRLLGRPDEALLLLKPHPAWPALRVEKARILAAKGDEAGAGLEIETLLRDFPPARLEYRHWASAWLLKGMLAERRKDGAAMEACWKAGRFEEWRSRSGEGRKPATSGMDHHLLILFASLSGEVTQEHISMSFAFLSQDASDGKVQRLQELALGMFKIEPSGLSGIFRSPRGFAYAREVAFLRIPLPELVDGPFRLLMQHFVSRLPGREISQDEEDIAWECAGRTSAAYRRGTLTMAQLLLLGSTYKGNLGLLGWSSLAPRLPKELRGLLAYFLAFQLEKIGKTAEAALLWKAAAADAPEEGPLRRLARQELSRLGQLKE